jgi:phosphatidylserine/phosphatidylglycerophosphate/cardiolipin synthase-like enzyme
VTISNLRWLIDGAPATSFVFGRRAEMAVDVSNFAGGDLVFKLKKSLVIELKSQAVPMSAVGGTPTTVRVPVILNHQWEVLARLPTMLSLFNESCKAGMARPYPTNASFLSNQITDDLLFPPLFFTVTEPGQQPVTSPSIRRVLPQFVPGNKVDLLVDGDKVLPSLLATIAAAQHHVHLNWFFFAPDQIGVKVADALKAAAARSVEVRLLFDLPATAMPEPLGQGVKPSVLLSQLAELAVTGVKIASSSMLVPPLDNRRTITDPEYRDRVEVMKRYVLTHMTLHGGSIAVATLPNLQQWALNTAKLQATALLAAKMLRSLSDLGSAGIGTPLLLGGARDHSKLIIVDGKVAYCGGLNCHRYYLYERAIDPAKDANAEMNDPSNPEKWLKWHDAFVRYEGPAVRDAQRYFAERWAVSSGEYLNRISTDYFPALSSVGSAGVKVINNVPGLERDIAAEYLRMFRNSQQKILVENPYVTDDLLATYMAHAAQVRSLPVELIVPEKYLDFAIARDLMKARWDALRAAGVKLYAYNSHMNHVKVATADGKHSIVSSYNFAKSSAAQLFECGIAVDDPTFAAEVERELFAVDRPVSTQVTSSTGTNWGAVCKSHLAFADRVV